MILRPRICMVSSGFEYVKSVSMIQTTDMIGIFMDGQPLIISLFYYIS